MTAKKMTLSGATQSVAVSTKEDNLSLVILTGEDKGAVYPLDKSRRIVIGRGKLCDVVLKDTKASREHAEIVFASGAFVVTDMKSQNGILVNQQKVLQASLQEGDKIVVGQTWFRIINSPEKAEDSLFGNTIEDDKNLNKPKTNKIVFYVLIFLVVFILFFTPDSEDNAAKKRTTSSPETIKKMSEVNSELVRKITESQKNTDKEMQKNIDTILKRGLRELREKNYYRAVLEFSHALDVNPKDAQAAFYLRKTYDEQDKVIKELNMAAARDIESLHYQRAIVSYCSILRLLYNFKQDKRYQEAVEKIFEVEEKIGKEKGETKCN